MTAMPSALTVHTSAAGRRYVAVSDLAKICGLGELDLSNKYKPEAWAMPRDFWWDGRRMWYAVTSLLQLADALLRADQGDASLKLREWAFAWVDAAMGEEAWREANRVKNSAGSGGTEPDTGISGEARTTAAPAAQGTPWYQSGGMA